MNIHIPPVSTELSAELMHRINDKTKPLGSLGKLEHFVHRLGMMQGTTKPVLRSPVVLVFAGDHGLAKAGASPYPQEVTMQMVMNYLAGGAAINVFVRQHGIPMRIIDAGIAVDMPAHPELLALKVRAGTRNAAEEAAMTLAEVDECLARGARVAQAEIEAGADAVMLGEMGIGNTAVSSLLVSSLLGLPIEDCVGRGAGHDDKGLQRKHKLCAAAKVRHGDFKCGREALAAYGGCEISMMVGAMLATAAARKLIVVDGFIATAAIVVASKINPRVLDYCVFSHASAESGHARVLKAIGVEPFVDLGLRLGEATGAVLIWPLLQSATAFLSEMATFSSAGVTESSAGKN